VPRIVARTIDALGTWVITFVSISVYADLTTPPTESSPVRELEQPTEEWREAYGELKADCEDAVRERIPHAFIPRPGLIVGPWDPTGRFTYWPSRIAASGQVLAPEESVQIQVTFAAPGHRTVVTVDRARRMGPQVRTNPRSITRRPEQRCSETCVEVSGADAELVWVDGNFLAAHDVGEWMELPLWLHDAEHRGMLSIAPTAAFAAGLETRPLAQTVRDTLAWVRSGDAPADAPAGLAREKERVVLDAWLSKE
jgi:2'-hydroxyisoflavone reductase